MRLGPVRRDGCRLAGIAEAADDEGGLGEVL
jgi:hypothetical protein